METIYLDTNATAPTAPEVAAAMEPWWRERPANPSAAHRYGQQARAAVEAARERVAALFGPDSRVVFTSGGTEADNQVLWSVAGQPPGGHLVVSAIEHPAILEPASALARLGVKVDLLPVDSSGRVRVERLAELLRPETRLVSVMTAHNELGTIQPLARIVEVAHSADVPVHTDAVQAVAWLAANATGGADFLSLSAHKIGGPAGIGALVMRNGSELPGWLLGGGQQDGRRGGTEPTPLIVGFGAACERVLREREAQSERVGGLRDRLAEGLRERIPDLVATVGGARTLPNTLHLCVPGADGQTLVARLDLDGVAASAGSACASGVTHGSAALEAIGLDPALRNATLRLSLGYHTTEDEIERSLERIPRAIAGVRNAIGSR